MNTWVYFTRDEKTTCDKKKYFIGEVESSLENDSGGEDIPIIL